MNSSSSAGAYVASSVDLVTNALLLSGLTDDDVIRLFHPGQFPETVMPSMLHEAAHWDTFATPVGHALTVAFLRAWRRTQVPSEEDEYESAMDLTRYRVFHELLRPLSEGLALFCEFDLVPGASPVTSTPTLLAGLMFGDPRAESLANLTLGQLAKLNLSIARERTLFRARKENLLCQNFETNQGGYLPGYYFIKNLRNYLVSRRKIFDVIDGDLLFYSVRAVIFGDIKLARLIIDPALDFILSQDPADYHRDAINAVMQRFQQLIEFLIHDIDGEYLKLLSEVITRDAWNWSDLCDPITRQPSNQADLALLIQETDMLVASGLNGSKEEQVASVCRRFIENRDLLCLGSLDVSIRVNEHGRCMVFTDEVVGLKIPRIVVSALNDTVPCDTTGTYELYLDRRAKQVLFSVVANQTCVACGCVNPDTSMDLTAFAARHPSMASAARLCSKIDDDLQASVGDYPTMDHYTSQIEHVTSRIYLQYCAAFTQSAGGDAKALIGNNLMNVANADFPFISDYAALSLLDSGILVPDMFINACAVLGITSDDFRVRLREWKLVKGIALHEEFGELLQFTF